ncbi:MAG: TIGR02757 family protein [Bdellovibrionales bacterium]|nr:TIGR02757 family protein [Bdellovibrionales bacterium]
MGKIRQTVSVSKLRKQKQVFASFVTKASMRTSSDPLVLPQKYTDPKDIEVAAWIASVFSFGNVKSFLPLLHSFHDVWHAQPYAYIKAQKFKKDKFWKSAYYRWYTSKDILKMLESTSVILQKYDSLYHHAKYVFDASNKTMQGFLLDYAQAWRKVLITKSRSRGLLFMVPDPTQKSTMKRMLMFLRWMIHSKKPDFGLWTFAEDLTLWIALDTHMFQFAHQFGWTKDKTPSMSTVQEISENMALVYPKDPMALDFVLTHLGISGQCKHQKTSSCPSCPLKSICNHA